MKIEYKDDFDFGFSLVDENELEVVQQAQQVVNTTSQTASATQEKLDKLYNLILPLLNNLAKNPEKEYIYWPDREKKLTEFRKKIDKLMGL